VTLPVSYGPGPNGLALSARGVWLLTSCTDPALLTRVWSLACSGASPSRLLTAVPGGDEAGGADWAVLLAPSTSQSVARLLLRGAVTVTIWPGPGSTAGTSETATLYGRPSLTWAEHELTSSWARVRICLGQHVSPATDASLPLLLGVAAAESLAVDVSSVLSPVSVSPPTTAETVSESSWHEVPSSVEEADQPPSNQPDDGSTRQYVPIELADAGLDAGATQLSSGPSVDELLADFFGDTIDRSVAGAVGPIDENSDAAPAEALPDGRAAANGEPIGVPPQADHVATSSPARPPEPEAPQSLQRIRDDVPSGAAPVLIDAIKWGEQTAEDEARRPPVPVLAEPHPAADPTAVADDGTDDVNVTTRRPLLSHRPVDELSVQVPAVDCPAGHPNPPEAVRCRVCGQSVPYREDTTLRVRPSLGRLRLSTGEVVTLDRDVVLGRSPAAPDRPGPMPHLVRVGADSSDVSRVHLLVQLDGWQVQAVDVSSNGTILETEGAPAEALPTKQPYPIKPGARLLLSDDVWVTFEDLP
jgi:hypothetical protein